MNINIEFEQDLHSEQQTIWNDFVLLSSDKKRCVANWGRQAGKTTLCKRSALYWAINDPGCSIGWLCPESKHFYKPFQWFRSIDHIVERVDGVKNVVRFINGSTIYFYSVENYDAIRGQTFDYRILDEYAFGRFGQLEAIAAYQATFAVNGKKDLIVSTPKGKNQHYKAFQSALEREDEVAVIAPSKANPHVADLFLQEMKQQYPDWLYNQEFNAVFLEGQSQVFGDISKNCVISAYEPTYEGKVYVGVDIALGGADATSIVILAADGTLVNRKWWRIENTSEQIRKMLELFSNYNIERGFIEMNTERGIAQEVGRHYPQVRQWNTNKQSKPPMIQHLKQDIQDDIIKLAVPELDPTLYSELQAFEGEVKPDGYVKYCAPYGEHDDAVISLALANEARVPNRYRPNHTTVRTISRNTKRNLT